MTCPRECLSFSRGYFDSMPPFLSTSCLHILVHPPCFTLINKTSSLYFVSVASVGVTKKSEVVKGELNPSWNEVSKMKFIRGLYMGKNDAGTPTFLFLTLGHSDHISIVCIAIQLLSRDTRFYF